MPLKTIKLLFIPVSGPKGVGEYMRSLCIARASEQAFSRVEIAFVLSEQAPYLHECPYKVYTCPSSPTNCSLEVCKAIDDFQASLVVFDASGRVSQFRHCQRSNVPVVYIAQHKNKLRRALAWRRLRFINQILLSQPRFILGELGAWSRWKLKILAKPKPRYLGPIFPRVAEENREKILRDLQLEKKNYIFLNAGGGGHKLRIKGQHLAVSDIFLAAANRIAQKTSLPVVVVLGPNSSLHEREEGGVKVIRSLVLPEFITLLAGCKAAVLSGGSALLQAISLEVENIVAVPVSNDQGERISACERYNLVYSSRADAEVISRVFSERIIRNGFAVNPGRGESKENILGECTAGSPLESGLDGAIASLKELVKTHDK